jgi:tRNA (guanine10-N2)-methyltransferase
VTIRKIDERKYPPPEFTLMLETASEEENIRVPAHKDFREKYFQGFRKSYSQEIQ